jgi:hypothetical protein
LDPVGSGLGPVAGSCEYGDESSGSSATKLVKSDFHSVSRPLTTGQVSLSSVLVFVKSIYVYILCSNNTSQYLQHTVYSTYIAYIASVSPGFEATQSQCHVTTD